jgi:hypothetical protein
MTITSIRRITNEAAFTVVLSKDDGRTRVELSTGTTQDNLDIWIPWCSNQSDFDGRKYLSVIALFRDTLFPGSTVAWWLFYLWQQDKQINVATAPAGFSSGVCVPSNCATGGDRRMLIRGTTTGGPVTGATGGGRVTDAVVTVSSYFL